MPKIVLYTFSKTIKNVIVNKYKEVCEIIIISTINDLENNNFDHIDAVIIDRTLQKGIYAENEVAKLRKLPITKNTPVILLTSSSMKNWRKEITPKPEFVLPKPFDFSVFSQLIRIWEKRKRVPVPPGILIIDDSGINRKIIIKTLKKGKRKLENTFFEAASSEEAISILEKNQNKIGLITLDLYMPGMNGLEFSREIRQREIFIPIIMITSEIDIQFKEEAFASGVNFYMTKPPEKEKLLDITANVFKKQKDVKGDKPLVILINDSVIVKSLLIKHLEFMELETISVDTAEKALPLIQNNTFSLIVLDYFLPEMNAPDLLKELKKLDLPDYQKVTLVHTSSDDPFLIDEVFALGVNDFINIPFSFQEFQIRVKNLIKLQHNLHSLYTKNKEYKKQNTDLISMNNRLVHAQKEILDLERKNSILAMIITANHEINQPLTVLGGSIELLKKSLEDKISNKEKLLISRVTKSLNTITDILRKYASATDFDIDKYCDTSNINMVVFPEKEKNK